MLVRRLSAATAATAALLVASPLPHAYACSVPAPYLTLHQDRVPAGGDLTITGHQYTGGCPPFTPPPHVDPSSETPSETPAETMTVTEDPVGSETPAPTETTAEATETPVETGTTTTAPPTVPPVEAPVLRPVAYAEPSEIDVYLAPDTTTKYNPAPAWFQIDTLPGSLMKKTSNGREFTGTVQIPSTVPPGKYLVSATYGDTRFQGDGLTVLAALPDTGAARSGDLTRLGLLSLLSGGVILAGGVAAARRRA